MHPLLSLGSIKKTHAKAQWGREDHYKEVPPRWNAQIYSKSGNRAHMTKHTGRTQQNKKWSTVTEDVVVNSQGTKTVWQSKLLLLIKWQHMFLTLWVVDWNFQKQPLPSSYWSSKDTFSFCCSKQSKRLKGHFHCITLVGCWRFGCDHHGRKEGPCISQFTITLLITKPNLTIVTFTTWFQIALYHCSKGITVQKASVISFHSILPYFLQRMYCISPIQPQTLLLPIKEFHLGGVRWKRYGENKWLILMVHTHKMATTFFFYGYTPFYITFIFFWLLLYL